MTNTVREVFAVGSDGPHMAIMMDPGTIVDGKASAAYKGTDRPVFSPDGMHVIFAADRDGQSWLVRDGKETGPYESIDSEKFSPDGRHVMFVVGHGQRFHVMLDDQPCGDDYDLIYTIEAGMPRFSPDSTRTEYMAHNGKSWFVVVDGKHLVYAGKRDGKALLVLDGKPGETYDRINEDTVKFSPDSQHLQYLALRHEGKMVVVEDGKPGLAWDRIDPASVKFSPDSNHIAYAGRSGAPAGGQEINSVVEDDIAGPAFGGVGSIQFSPDGKHLAYEAEQDGKSFVVIDGRQSQSFDAVAGESVCFTADGQLHFFADRDGSMYRVDYLASR